MNLHCNFYLQDKANANASNNLSANLSIPIGRYQSREHPFLPIGVLKFCEIILGFAVSFCKPFCVHLNEV